jgi:beta-lactamase regulating signal transducer with metallopeptidase domain
MMAAWMLYCVLCALGLSLAAALAERALLAGRGPVRHVWLGAVILSLVVPVVAFRYAPRSVANAPSSVGQDLGADEPVAGSPTTDAQSNSAPTSAVTQAPASITASRINWRAVAARADQPLTIAWLVLSLALALHFVVGLAVLARTRRAWGPRVVLGVPVLVSERTGPALVGAVSPAIVVPEWVLALESPQLALMLRHEQEHQRAHDGQLLFAAQLALIAMPWNVALWWQILRLRVAVELDCDARVLRDADARSYGNLLLEVVRPRAALVPMGVASFAERATQLERRIRVMAQLRNRGLRGARVLAACVVLAAVTIAWIAPRPPVPTPSVVQAPVVPVVAAPPPRDTSASRSVPLAQGTVKPRPDTVQAAPPATASAITPADSVRPDSAGPRKAPSDSSAASNVPAPMPVVPGLGGRGLAGNSAQLPDQIFSRLFDSIPLTPDQQAKARDVIAKLIRDQAAQQDSMAPAMAAYTSASAALRVARDSVLMSLLSSDADRAALAARLAQPPGGGRRGGGGQPNGQAPAGGGRSNVPPGAPPGAGGRSGPGGALPDSAALADAAFTRLFEGIVLTPDQESRARAAIMKTQTDQRALVPPRIPQLVALRPFQPTVLVEAKSDSALMALLTNDADRQKLRARIVNPPPNLR